MKKRISNLLLVLVFIIGLSLLLYPTFANWWNSRTASYVMADYLGGVATLDNDSYQELWEKAEEFNRTHALAGNSVSPENDWEEYLSQLSVRDSSVMGVVEVPSIGVTLPIYHGTGEDALSAGVGHVEWSCLPIGGEGTHCVLSGHRGLPSARLFTDLDRVVEGDIFTLDILDERLTYQVDQILIVLPQELGDLRNVEGKDYCTLVTCTPYGVNSHRLLVRGHRIENEIEKGAVRVTADAIQIEPSVVAPVIMAPILFLLMLWALLRPRKRPAAKPVYDSSTKKKVE